MISRITKEQGPGGNLLIPNRPLEDGSPARLPEVATGKQSAAARGTGWGVDRSVGEKNPFHHQFIKIRGLGDVVDASSGKRQSPNLEAAGHMLDLLVVLADKTKGNLTPGEEVFLTRVLKELRMRYAEACNSGGSATP